MKLVFPMLALFMLVALKSERVSWRTYLVLCAGATVVVVAFALAIFVLSPLQDPTQVVDTTSGYAGTR
ncbi:MAG TPA: hypothetical protein VGB83_04520 [Actinomycetota bacterium]